MRRFACIKMKVRAGRECVTTLSTVDVMTLLVLYIAKFDFFFNFAYSSFKGFFFNRILATFGKYDCILGILNKRMRFYYF